MTTDTHEARTQIQERCRAILKASPTPIGPDTLALQSKAPRASLVNDILRADSSFRQVAGDWSEGGFRWCLSNSIAAHDARRACVRKHVGGAMADGNWHSSGKPVEPIQEGGGAARGITCLSDEAKARKGEACAEKVRELMSDGECRTNDEIQHHLGLTHAAVKGALAIIGAVPSSRTVVQVVEGKARSQTMRTWVLAKVPA